MHKPLRILLIGATGVFGSRLLALLEDDARMIFIFAGRRRDVLEKAASSGKQRHEIAVLDRNTITADQLRELSINVVVDAAGPFQDSQTQVIDAAIQAGCHYLDLADGRAFVDNIAKHHAHACARDVAIITGASSVPALSHAVVDHLTAGWRDIAKIRVGIFPGNRAPRGLSVVESILSYAGKPVRVFRQGGWQHVSGWGMTHRIEVPGIGTRWASVCDTPDQDLLVSRYQPKISAEFFAGLELSFLHLGLSFLSLFVRAKLIRSLRPFARPMLWVAQKFIAFGSDRGGMMVHASGINAEGIASTATWILQANANHGPSVPIIATACLLRKFCNKTLDFRGASACTGLLTLDDFLPDFTKLGLITEKQQIKLPVPIFAQALAADFQHLPETTRTLHTPAAGAVWRGTADVTGGDNLISTVIARLMRFPTEGKAQPLRVVIDPSANGDETWHRIYQQRTMTSIMTRPDSANATLEEKFGFLAVRLKITATTTGLNLSPVSWRFGPVPLPRFLIPKITAIETAQGDSHHFHVDVALPLIGRLVCYRGQLKKA
jgi:hypothetical protein